MILRLSIATSRPPPGAGRRTRSMPSLRTFWRRSAGRPSAATKRVRPRCSSPRDIVIRLLIDMPSTAGDRQSLFAELGTRLGRARRGIGPLAYVFLATEAWMVQRRDALPGVLPSAHPSRIEILSFATWQGSTNAYQVRIYRLLRDGDGTVRDLVVEQDWQEARAYLVEAFVNAYPQMTP